MGMLTFSISTGSFFLGMVAMAIIWFLIWAIPKIQFKKKEVTKPAG